MIIQNIYGIDRTKEDIGQLVKWNQKRITWTIVHQTQKEAIRYFIELQMELIRSERIVKVNGQIKHKALISFGYKSEFQISKELKGSISQNGLTFQLFINGQNFENLSKKVYKYQPPKIQTNEHEFYPELKKHKTQIDVKVQEKAIQQKQSVSLSKNQNKKPKQFVNPQPKNAFQAVKDAQKQLMRLMIEEKKKKKENQLLKNKPN